VTGTHLRLSVAAMICLSFVARVHAQESTGHPPSGLERIDAEYQFEMHQLELKMAELGVEEAVVELEKCQLRLLSAAKRGDSDEVGHAKMDVRKAEIRVKMAKVRCEMVRCEINHSKAWLISILAPRSEKHGRASSTSITDESGNTRLSKKAEAFLKSLDEKPSDFYFMVEYFEPSMNSDLRIMLRTPAPKGTEWKGAVVIDKAIARKIVTYLARAGLIDQAGIAPPGQPLKGWSVYLHTGDNNAFWFLGKDKAALLNAKHILKVGSQLEGEALRAWDVFLGQVKEAVEK
jgi:hypothetical protein